MNLIFKVKKNIKASAHFKRKKFGGKVSKKYRVYFIFIRANRTRISLKTRI